MLSSTVNSDFLSLSMMLKAVPVEDGRRRFVYCEASDETLDAQGEVVMQKALADSMEYMLARGNLDIDHYTMIGAKQGIPDYLTYEIGLPLEISFHSGKTLVKGEIYSGVGPAADRANQFWSSIVDLNPPSRWYPSVGGAIQAAENFIDPSTKAKGRRITKVRWSNIGFSKQPVNQSVPAAQAVPMGVFAKSWAVDGFFKTLEAGYGSDVSALTGGGALRTQSLHGYKNYRDQVSQLILDGVIPVSDGIDASISHFNLSREQATAWFHQFLTDLKHRGTQ